MVPQSVFSQGGINPGFYELTLNFLNTKHPDNLFGIIIDLTDFEKNLSKQGLTVFYIGLATM